MITQFISSFLLIAGSLLEYFVPSQLETSVLCYHKAWNRKTINCQDGCNMWSICILRNCILSVESNSRQHPFALFWYRTSCTRSHSFSRYHARESKGARWLRWRRDAKPGEDRRRRECWCSVGAGRDRDIYTEIVELIYFRRSFLDPGLRSVRCLFQGAGIRGYRLTGAGQENPKILINKLPRVFPTLLNFSIGGRLSPWPQAGPGSTEHSYSSPPPHPHRTFRKWSGNLLQPRSMHLPLLSYFQTILTFMTGRTPFSKPETWSITSKIRLPSHHYACGYRNFDSTRQYLAGSW